MPRKCSICEHPEREAIDKALVESQNITKIAKRFNVSYDALLRHKQRHISKALVKAQEAHELSKASSLVDQIYELRDKAIAILERAEQAGDLKTALQGIREARGCLELLASVQTADLEERVENLEEIILRRNQRWAV